MLTDTTSPRGQILVAIAGLLLGWAAVCVAAYVIGDLVMAVFVGVLGLALVVVLVARLLASLESTLRAHEQRVRDAQRQLEIMADRKRADEERARLEGQMRRSQKLETIGTLAGGIAHDFNNILSAILGYVQLAMLDLPADSQLREDLDQIKEGANRATTLVKQILTFSRQEEQDRRPMRLQSVVEEAMRLIRASIPPAIDIHQEIDTECPAISADATQMHQVIMNLCTNGAQAMESGGTLTVKLSVLDASALPATLPSPDEQQYVRLVVADTGCGMDEQTLDRVFEPFFTTKGVGSGTGLGLSVVHGIVSGHDGFVEAESQVGRGTTFTLYLPVIEADVTAAVSGSEPEGGGERILVVDDEEALVLMLQRTLRRYGYTVEVRTSSREALEAFRAQPGKFDLVLTDYAMPGMTGTELATQLTGLRPDLPVILFTGFSQHFAVKSLQRLGIRECLFKPMVASELAATIRSVLDEASRDQAWSRRVG